MIQSMLDMAEGIINYFLLRKFIINSDAMKTQFVLL